MAKRRKGKSSKVAANRKRFGSAVRECHKSTDSPKNFGKCMSKKLK